MVGFGWGPTLNKDNFLRTDIVTVVYYQVVSSEDYTHVHFCTK